MEIENEQNQKQNQPDQKSSSKSTSHTGKEKRKFDSIENVIFKCKDSKSNSLVICDQPLLSEFFGIRNDHVKSEQKKLANNNDNSNSMNIVENNQNEENRNQSQAIQKEIDSSLFGDSLFCQSLSILTLSRCSLTEIPQSISLFSNLKQISFANNRLSNLPSTFVKLQQLESVFLSLNTFEEIPTEIFNLENLSELDIGSNPAIDSIPNEIEKISKTLSKIRLYDCSFTQFPKQLSKNLPALKEIDLAKNKIKSIEVDEISLKSLEVFELSKNELEEVPLVNSHWSLPSLQRLYLSHNKLSVLRSELIDCPKIQILTVGSNQLKKLEFVMRFSKSLEELQASLNNIETIPDSFYLMNLRHLDLSYNDIVSLPESFAKMQSLKSLYLIGNVFQTMPALLSALSCNKHKIVSHTRPDEIIPFVFLGTFLDAKNKHLLKRLGITHVLSICEMDALHPQDFTYHQIQVPDDAEVSLRRYFPECHEFIDDSLRSGGKVLVHCAAGVSRSPAIVLSYLMAKHHLTFHTAFQLVRAGRPVVSPNEGFTRELKIYEDWLFEQGFELSAKISEHHQKHFEQQRREEIGNNGHELIENNQKLKGGNQTSSTIEEGYANCNIV